MSALRDLCDEHGIVLVVDEVQTGFGRTGKLFAIEHYGIEPDLITVAKSIASGLPLSGVLGKAEIVDAAHDGAVGGTYVGNPVALAAAHAVLDVIDEEALCERAASIGEVIRGRMLAWQERFPAIGDVRGLGAMLAIELVQRPRHEGAGPGARGRRDRCRLAARTAPPQGRRARQLHPRPVPARDRRRRARRGARRLGRRARSRRSTSFSPRGNARFRCLWGN